MRSSVLRSLRGRLVINLESTRKLRLSRTNSEPGRKKGQKSINPNMARKGNPISVRLGKNRSSDSSRFSEGDRESHRMAKSFPSVYTLFSKKRGRTLQMSGTDTTSSNARKTTGKHPEPEHVVKEAHWMGVLRPCLRGTVECRYH